MQALIAVLIVFTAWQLYKNGKLNHKENIELAMYKEQVEELKKEITDLREKYYALKYSKEG